MSDPEFRLINDDEIHAIHASARSNGHPLIRSLLSDSETIYVNYERQPGGFCICTVSVVNHTKATTTLYRGCSRRSYKDSPNKVRGEMIAFSRLVKFSRGLSI